MWINVQQNTPEWDALRLGKATSSNFDKIMANEGKAFGNPAIEYAQKIALEVVMGVKDESDEFRSGYMDMGTQYEPVARERYEMETFTDVINGGFNDWGTWGDSPDGNINPDGCLEIKCVIPKTHWNRLKKGGYDLSYKWQICGHIWLGEKEWCDFVSFCPWMPENKQLYINRVYRDEDMIKRLESRLTDFNDKVLEHIFLLKK